MRLGLRIPLFHRVSSKASFHRKESFVLPDLFIRRQAFKTSRKIRRVKMNVVRVVAVPRQFRNRMLPDLNLQTFVRAVKTQLLQISVREKPHIGVTRMSLFRQFVQMPVYPLKHLDALEEADIPVNGTLRPAAYVVLPPTQKLQSFSAGLFASARSRISSIRTFSGISSTFRATKRIARASSDLSSSRPSR